MAQTVMGTLAGALSLASCFLYAWDILRGHTHPNRATWWVLALVNFAIAGSSFSAGARDTVWLPASYAAGFGAIGILSLWRGEGRWSRIDLCCVVGAIAGLGMWLSLNASLAALALLILMDAVGFAPTIAKASQRPWTEDRRAWTLAAIASLLNCTAVDDWHSMVVAYPLYVAAGNFAMVWLLWRPRETVAA